METNSVAAKLVYLLVFMASNVVNMQLLIIIYVIFYINIASLTMNIIYFLLEGVPFVHPRKYAPAASFVRTIG